MKRIYNNKRITNIIISLILISILVFSKPVGAVNVQLDLDNIDGLKVGQSGYFYFNITIGGNEKIPIANFSIEGLPEIPGSPDGTLFFNLNDIGTIVGNNTTKGNYVIELVTINGWTGDTENCTGYQYNNDTPPYYGYGYGYTFNNYDYGYGYGNGTTTQYTQLAYKINVDTTGATSGTYDNVIGKVNTGDLGKPNFSTSTTSFQLNSDVSIENVTLAPGENTTVPIMINNVENLGGCRINLVYNASVVHVSEVLQGDMDYLTYNIDNGTGWMTANALNDSGLNGDIVFANIELNAVGIKGDETLLNITVVQLIDTGFIPIDHIVIDGTCIIEEDTEAPVVTDASASPDTILNDNGRPRAPGTNTTTLSVTVTDADSGVANVTINLLSIGGSEDEPMIREGETDVWTVTINAVAGINLTHHLTVNATDNKGNFNDSVSITLTVLRRGDVCRNNVIDNNDVTYIARYLAGLEPECSNPPDILVADVVGLSGDAKGDSIVDLMDALYLTRYIAGLEVEP